MTISEVLASARYIVDANGNRTEVVLPVQTWETLLQIWQRLAELLEDQADHVIIKTWLAERATGQTKRMSLDELEQELRNERITQPS
ncbi:MAG: hypothetical protein WCP31_09890 [Chloroflexales bacterium]